MIEQSRKWKARAVLLGLPLSELLREAGVSPSFFRAIQSGNVSYPEYEILEQFRKKIGILPLLKTEATSAAVRNWIAIERILHQYKDGDK